MVRSRGGMKDSSKQIGSGKGVDCLFFMGSQTVVMSLGIGELCAEEEKIL